MTGRVLAEIALKTWAIMILAQVLGSLPSAAVNLFGSEDVVMSRLITANVIAGILGQAFVGLSLLIWGRKISQWFLPETPKLQLQFSFDQLSALCLVVVGVFLALEGIGGLMYVGYESYFRPDRDELLRMSYQLNRYREVVVRSLLEIILGVILLMGRERLAQGWLRLRGGL